MEDSLSPRLIVGALLAWLVRFLLEASAATCPAPEPREPAVHAVAHIIIITEYLVVIQQSVCPAGCS